MKYRNIFTDEIVFVDSENVERVEYTKQNPVFPVKDKMFQGETIYIPDTEKPIYHFSKPYGAFMQSHTLIKQR